MNTPLPVDFSKMAGISDLSLPEFRTITNQLESVQAEFLQKEREFRSADYRWPSAALHWWSRIWEYPYVFRHMTSLMNPLAGRKVLDLGSGVTFFPFALARAGFHVTATDIDPVCGIDLARATSCLSTAPGQVDFRHITDTILPCEDGQFDAVYCISVLEHVASPPPLIQDIARVLKPNGLLFLTIDLDLSGTGQIGVAGYQELEQALACWFEPELPEMITHPADLLLSCNGPFPLQTSALDRGWFWFKNQVIKPALGRSALKPVKLAVKGSVLRKRGDKVRQ